jgi:hypothetical protein
MNLIRLNCFIKYLTINYFKNKQFIMKVAIILLNDII